jgi:hypothetical protein
MGYKGVLAFQKIVQYRLIQLCKEMAARQIVSGGLQIGDLDNALGVLRNIIGHSTRFPLPRFAARKTTSNQNKQYVGIPRAHIQK